MSQKQHHDDSNIWDILHIVFVVVFILSVLGAGGYAYYYFFYKDKEETVTIPSFIGQNIEQAQVSAQSMGFSIKVKKEVFSKKRVGTIEEQDPLPDSTTKAGRAIYVTISKGEEKIEIPDVLGIDYRQASNLLKQAGFKKISVVQKYDKSVSPGTVISQYPSARSLISVDKEIVLASSRIASLDVTIPDLKGEKIEVAEEKLNALNVKYTKTEVASKEFKEGIVISQDVKPGTLADSSIIVNLKVSSSEAVGMSIAPDLVGKTVEEASEICKSLKLDLEVKGDFSPDSMIAEQLPKAGAELAENSRISVSIGMLSVVPNCVGKSLGEIRKTLEDSGFVIGVINYVQSNDVDEDIVLAQDPAGGVWLPENSKINLTISGALEYSVKEVIEVKGENQNQSSENVENNTNNTHNTQEDDNFIEYQGTNNNKNNVVIPDNDIPW